MKRGAVRNTAHSEETPEPPSADQLRGLFRGMLMSQTGLQRISRGLVESDKFLQKVVEIAADAGEKDADSHALPSLDVRILQVMATVPPEDLKRYVETGEIDVKLLSGNGGGVKR